MLFLSAYILFICVSMYVWLCWVFVSVRGLSLVVASGGHSSSRCVGLSPSRPLAAEHRLQTLRLSNCGSRAELLRGMWDLPRPGLEHTSPALAGRFSTTAPPGKPNPPFFNLVPYLETEELPGLTMQLFLEISSLVINSSSDSHSLSVLYLFIYGQEARWLSQSALY